MTKEALGSNSAGKTQQVMKSTDAMEAQQQLLQQTSYPTMAPSEVECHRREILRCRMTLGSFLFPCDDAAALFHLGVPALVSKGPSREQWL